MVAEPRPRLTAILPAGDPTGFTATVQGRNVVLRWQPVSGVTQYLLAGPNLGAGQKSPATSITVSGLGPGSYEWTVASLGPDGAPLHPGSEWPKAQAVFDTSVYSLYSVTFLPLSLGGRMGGDGPMVDLTADNVSLHGENALILERDSDVRVRSMNPLPNGTYALRLNFGNLAAGQQINLTLHRYQRGTPPDQGPVVGQCSVGSFGTCLAQIPVTANEFDVYAYFGPSGSGYPPKLLSVSLVAGP
jgi:hypothetical protein